MNIIKHVWCTLEHMVQTRHRLPQNKEQLWAALQEEWERIPLSYIRDLYRSMPRRVATLKEVRGSYTCY